MASKNKLIVFFTVHFIWCVLAFAANQIWPTCPAVSIIPKWAPYSTKRAFFHRLTRTLYLKRKYVVLHISTHLVPAFKYLTVRQSKTTFDNQGTELITLRRADNDIAEDDDDSYKPGPYWSLMLEISEGPLKEISNATLVEQV